VTSRLSSSLSLTTSDAIAGIGRDTARVSGNKLFRILLKTPFTLSEQLHSKEPLLESLHRLPVQNVDYFVTLTLPLCFGGQHCTLLYLMMGVNTVSTQGCG